MKDPIIKGQILEYLKNFHVGRPKAKKACELAVMYRMDVRSINEVIRTLRKEGHLIGSMKEKPFGYYIPANEEEVMHCVETFKQETLDMIDTFRKMRRAQKIILEDFRQPDLFKPDPSGQLAFG